MFVHQLGYMGWATSKGNEAKWKMKHLYDIAESGFEPRCYKSVANHSTNWAMEAPDIHQKVIDINANRIQASNLTEHINPITTDITELCLRNCCFVYPWHWSDLRYKTNGLQAEKLYHEAEAFTHGWNIPFIQAPLQSDPITWRSPVYCTTKCTISVIVSFNYYSNCNSKQDLEINHSIQLKCNQVR